MVVKQDTISNKYVKQNALCVDEKRQWSWMTHSYLIFCIKRSPLLTCNMQNCFVLINYIIASQIYEDYEILTMKLKVLWSILELSVPFSKEKL